jgi:3-oxoacyl-[acyl-carrier protein] reductase
MAQIAALPLRRLGTPGEVAESVAFLASSPAGDFYTGQTLHPNGGDVMP